MDLGVILRFALSLPTDANPNSLVLFKFTTKFLVVSNNPLRVVSRAKGSQRGQRGRGKGVKSALGSLRGELDLDCGSECPSHLTDFSVG